MKILLKKYAGFALLIVLYWFCSGDENNWMEASQVGKAVKDYLTIHHSQVKVSNIKIQDGVFAISLENGLVILCDSKGNCKQDSLVQQ